MPGRPDTTPNVVAALRDFVARIDELAPSAPSLGELTVSLGRDTAAVPLRAPVARALVEALLAYHDPRDRGTCDHCGARQLDENFLCRHCGSANGVFGQLLAERLARHAAEPAPTAITDCPQAPDSAAPHPPPDDDRA